MDENGNQINGAFTTSPGFPGFGPINASQTLAYMADSLEAGLPVVNGYIADIHGNENIPGLAACKGAPAALGSGTACYVAQAQYYNAAFGTFFKRLAADGITPANTEFMLSPDEGDHEAGANVGRAIQPTPANCNGTSIPCTYPAGSFGELAGNMTGLLATQKNDTTPFSLESDTAPEFYVTGNPGPNDPKVRTLERDVAGLTASNPYAGGTQKITNYLADPAEMAILHMVNADPARTPTFALFAKPDYFFTPGSATCAAAGCVTQNTGFAWDHGDYAAEINTNYAAFAGPGVKHLGLDGQAPNTGPSSAGREQRPGRRGRQRHHRHLDGRDRPAPDPDVPDRPQGRLRAGRPGRHRRSWPPRTARWPRPAWPRWAPATSSSTPASASSAPSPCRPRRPPSSPAPRPTPSTRRSTPR